MASVVGLCVATAWLTGCARLHHDSTVAVSSGAYASSFEHAKQVLRDQNFDLDRVDARTGVITTKPKSTAGLATPWDAEQTSLGAEADDFLSNRARVVRVWFEPAAERPASNDAELAPAVAPIPVEPGAPSAPGVMPTDMRTYDGVVQARVDVVLLSSQRPGLRLDSTSIRMQSRMFDPALGRRGLYPSYDVPVGRDEALERRIAGRLKEVLVREQLTPETQ